jgi:hypothetical protein
MQVCLALSCVGLFVDLVMLCAGLLQQSDFSCRGMGFLCGMNFP